MTGVSIMLLLMFCGVLFTAVTQGQSTHCPLSTDVDLAGDGMLLLRHVINQFNMTITVELEYVGIGWVGMAFSNTQFMIPNTAIIGLPNEGTVLKYELTSRIILGVVPASADRQTLTDTSIVQENGVTTLKFTRALTETDETTIGLNTNTILVAYGSSNALNYHAFSLPTKATFLTLCDAAASPAPFFPVVVPVAVPEAVPVLAPDSPTVSPANIAAEPTMAPTERGKVKSIEPTVAPVPSGDGFSPAVTPMETPILATLPTPRSDARPNPIVKLNWNTLIFAFGSTLILNLFKEI